MRPGDPSACADFLVLNRIVMSPTRRKFSELDRNCVPFDKINTLSWCIRGGKTIKLCEQNFLFFNFDPSCSESPHGVWRFLLLFRVRAVYGTNKISLCTGQHWKFCNKVHPFRGLNSSARCFKHTPNVAPTQRPQEEQVFQRRKALNICFAKSASIEHCDRIIGQWVTLHLVRM